MMLVTSIELPYVPDPVLVGFIEPFFFHLL